jgi:prolipoprotein diacylglyceryltransferase
MTLSPIVRVGSREWSAFRFFGVAGLVAGVTLGAALATRLALSPWIVLGIAISAVLTFLCLAMATKIVTGREQLTFYHHLAAVLAVAAGLLAVAGQPVLPYLDLCVLGTGMFLVFGRAGCLMVGCCHGCVSKWGLRYGHAHVEAGFTRTLAGVRLLPVPACEAIWTLGLVVLGSALVFAGHPPGAALSWFLMGYAAGRFYFEFLRGDADRLYLAGLSEAQWTSVLIAGAVPGAELAGVLPLRAIHVVAAIVLGCASAVFVFRRRDSRHAIESARHATEVAGAVSFRATPSTAGGIQLYRTSLGVQISFGEIRAGLQHYTLSSQDGSMDRASADSLAAMILKLRNSSHPGQVIGGQRGVFHLLIGAEARKD